MGDVTALLDRWNRGDREALKELLATVHGELRQLAGSLLRHERSDHTLQPTDLVHEAYLRLSGLQEMSFEGRRHFYGAAAQSMRRSHATTSPGFGSSQPRATLSQTAPKIRSRSPSKKSWHR